MKNSHRNLKEEKKKSKEEKSSKENTHTKRKEENKSVDFGEVMRKVLSFNPKKLASWFF